MAKLLSRNGIVVLGLILILTPITTWSQTVAETITVDLSDPSTYTVGGDGVDPFFYGLSVISDANTLFQTEVKAKFANVCVDYPVTGSPNPAVYLENGDKCSTNFLSGADQLVLLNTIGAPTINDVDLNLNLYRIKMGPLPVTLQIKVADPLGASVCTTSFGSLSSSSAPGYNAQVDVSMMNTFSKTVSI